MTKTEENRLDELLCIADEDDSPLSDWEAEFVQSLDKKRHLEMTPKQGEVFDRLVEKHLK